MKSAVSRLALAALLATAACGTATSEEPTPPAPEEKAEPRPRPIRPLFDKPDDRHALPQWGTGPMDVRDPYPLALAHFTIPFESPATPPAGSVELRGPEFVWANTQIIEEAGVVDAETVTGYLRCGLGLTDRWEIALEIPYYWLGGGIQDVYIDKFHNRLKILDAHRENRERNSFQISRKDTRIRRGGRVGDLAAGTKFRFFDGSWWLPAVSASLWLKAPTSSSASLGQQGWDVAGSVQVSKRLGAIVLDAGCGATILTDVRLGDFEYERMGFMAWGGGEIGIVPGLTFEAHTSYRSPHLKDSGDLSRARLYLVLGLRYAARIPVDGRFLDVECALGILENYGPLTTTADFGFVFSVLIRM